MDKYSHHSNDNPTTFKQLRPISLCDFNNKMLTKLLILRLAKALPQLISPEQSGFVKGRLIQDNILLSQKLLQSINKKVHGSNIVLNLDMHKAYDSVHWTALTMIMRKFGFCEVWIDMIWRVISNC